MFARKSLFIIGMALFTVLLGLPAVAQSELLVSNYGRNEILRYRNDTGAFMDVFVPFGSGGLWGVGGMTMGPDGNLYVCSLFDHPDTAFEGSILRYNGITGAFMNVFVPNGSGGMNRPQNLAFGPDGNLYVCSVDNGHDYILRFNGQTGAFMDTFVPRESIESGVPLNLLFGPDGNLYVCGNNKVARYNGTTGAFMNVFASGGGLSGPHGLTFGPDGNLYVSSYFTGKVLRYNGTTGAFMNVFASGGGLTTPGYGLAFGLDGNLYVADFRVGGNVLRYNRSTGAFMGVFIADGSGGLDIPLYLLFRDPPTATVSGRITLEACQNSVQPVIFTFRPIDGSPAFFRTLTINANGTFTLTNVVRKNYMLAIKGVKWLQKVVSVDASNGDVNNVSALLPAGDATNDNIVDVNDLAALIEAFDAAPASPNWNDGIADFDCNDIVDVEDLSLLIRNFDQSGDP